jgi:hypothetical protein
MYSIRPSAIEIDEVSVGVVPAGMLPKLPWLGTYLRHPEVL